MEVSTAVNLVNSKQAADPELEQQKREQLKENPTRLVSKLVPIGNGKFITIRKHRGDMKINIRDYVRDSCEKLYSTKRGIMLNVQEWNNLKESISLVDEILQKRELKASDYSHLNARFVKI